MAGVEEFVRVAETRSFVRAAETLHLSTSGVAKAVKGLETRLGVRLLHRTTRSVRLTEDGASFYARAKQLIADLDRAEASLSATGADLQGTIRIEMPVSYGRLLFMPRLMSFLARYPRLRVEVHMVDHSSADLIAAGFDLAVRAGDMKDSGLVSRPLETLALGTYAQRAYIERHGKPDVPADLAQHRLVVFMHRSGRMQPLLYRHEGKLQSVDAADAIASFDNGDAMTDAVIAGMGIAQLPAFHVAAALAQGSLVQILDGWDAPGPSVQLVYASRLHLPARVRALVDFMCDVPETVQPTAFLSRSISA